MYIPLTKQEPNNVYSLQIKSTKNNNNNDNNNDHNNNNNYMLFLLCI